MADQSKNKWFPWRRLLRSTQTPRPETREVAVSQVTDKYSEYPSDGLTPVRLAEIFKEADAGDVLRQAELFEEMEERKTPEAKLYKALDKLEALIQHNEAKLSTWLPLEYDLQMTYGSKECSFCTYMEHLRETVREDSCRKIRKESEQQ